MNLKTTNELFTVGLRVTCPGDMMTPRGEGAIVRLNEPTPYSGASVDVILSDGRRVNAFPAFALRPIEDERGCAHRVLVHPGRYADEAELAALEAGAVMREARERARAEEARRKFEAERAALVAQYPMLKTASDGSYLTRAQITGNMRAILKLQFPGVKFGVRLTSGGYSVSVRWTGGPSSADVGEWVGRFQAGHYDGMDDSYHYNRTAWGDTFGTVRYIFVDRDDE